MAIVLMDTFIGRFGLSNVAAATEAGLVVGYNEQMIRLWHTDFYSNKGEFSASAQGKHTRPYVLDDETCQKCTVLVTEICLPKWTTQYDSCHICSMGKCRFVPYLVRSLHVLQESG